MKPFKKINVKFDYTKLRNDVSNVTEQIKAEQGWIVPRNICLTVPTKDSDDWTDGIAGKTYHNKHDTI
jgi:hypothetical protein